MGITRTPDKVGSVYKRLNAETHWALDAAMAVLLAMSTSALLVTGSRAAAMGLADVVFSLPCILFFWFVRKGLHITIRLQWSTVVTGYYLIICLLSLICLLYFGLALSNIFLAMALAGLAAFGVFVVLLASDLPLRRCNAAAAIILRDHIGYGGLLGREEVCWR